jgi:hypothetical protein
MTLCDDPCPCRWLQQLGSLLEICYAPRLNSNIFVFLFFFRDLEISVLRFWFSCPLGCSSSCLRAVTKIFSRRLLGSYRFRILCLFLLLFFPPTLPNSSSPRLSSAIYCFSISVVRDSLNVNAISFCRAFHAIQIFSSW